MVLIDNYKQELNFEYPYHQDRNSKVYTFPNGKSVLIPQQGTIYKNNFEEVYVPRVGSGYTSKLLEKVVGIYSINIPELDFIRYKFNLEVIDNKGWRFDMSGHRFCHIHYFIKIKSGIGVWSYSDFNERISKELSKYTGYRFHVFSEDTQVNVIDFQRRKEEEIRRIRKEEDEKLQEKRRIENEKRISCYYPTATELTITEIVGGTLMGTPYESWSRHKEL